MNSGSMLTKEETWLLQEKYQGDKTAGFFADCERLKVGEPLAYVIGQIPFLGSMIYLDSKPLIPRAETEFWVEYLLKEIKTPSEAKPRLATTSPLRILDLCAGSGCIGVALAKALPSIQVDFIEIDQNHLALIEKNCRENQIPKDRIRVITSDLFINLAETTAYDYIISNPPYIDPILDRTQVSVKSFEPSLALYGGEGGLEIIKKIIAEAPNYLKAKGELWLEHEPEQSEMIASLGNTLFFVTTNQDQYQVDRFSRLVLK